MNTNQQLAPILRRTPAAQAAARIATVANLAEAKPIGKGALTTAQQKKANDKGHAADGASIAEKAWRYVQSDSLTLRDLASDVMYLDNAGRVAFREGLQKHKDEAKKNDKIASTAVTRSAFIRVSELMTISRAADAGIKPHDVCSFWDKKTESGKGTYEWVGMSYPSILEACRTMVNSGATLDDGTVVQKIGPRVKAGRKTETPEQKLTKYILRTFSPKDFPKLAAQAKTLAATIHSAAEAKAALAKKG